MKFPKYILLAAFSAVLLSSCGSYKDLGIESKWDIETFRASQKSFTSADGDIAYIDKGEGDVIVLLHGVPSSGWLYREMIDGLAAEGYRIIVPDMLGFGNSGHPEGYEIYSNENHAKRLLALMDSLDINSWTQVVHDAGGPWTWELIKLDDSKISNLIILNTVLYDEGFTPPIRLKEGAFAKLAMSFYRGAMTRKFMLNRFMKKALKDTSILSKSEFEGYLRPLEEGKTNGMYYFFTNIRKPFPEYDSTLASIDIPKIVIWGMADEMLQLIPQKERIINEMNVSESNIYRLNASHFLQEERPEKVNELIINFLK